ncbi:hypothetical protein AT728_29720 [Streptomyces silvensis]|uniref:Uncharacterized protein n=2 Tax=Streptomyces silvensis TaxID=1765722 RepID=A0A0W7WY63_9ACTN|nr:hypothetical protein AT728_29720 [Streptomyces silvensis]
MDPEGTAPEGTEEPVVGDLVIDEARKRMGVVTGRVGGRLQIRPPAGGTEWDCGPEFARPARADEIVRVNVAAVSAKYQGRRA